MPTAYFAYVNPLVLAAAGQAGRIGVADAPGIPWLRIFVALLVCIGIAIAAVFLLRQIVRRGKLGMINSKFGRIANGTDIEILESRRASIHGHICLIHCRGHAYLIAMTAGGASLIDKMPIEADGKVGT